MNILVWKGINIKVTITGELSEQEFEIQHELEYEVAPTAPNGNDVHYDILAIIIQEEMNRFAITLAQKLAPKSTEIAAVLIEERNKE